MEDKHRKILPEADPRSPFSVRVRQSIQDRIREIATEEDRTFAVVTENLLQDALERRPKARRGRK